MITFFTHCRAFRGEFDQLQRTAIESWKSAVPGCQVFLFGPDRSIKRAAREHVAHYGGAVETNEYGTPLVNDLFRRIEPLASYDLLCEISSDIVLGADVNRALQALGLDKPSWDIERPFVIGQRLDIDPGADPETATLHAPAAADYFIYRKGTLGEIPPFAIGRTAYDNWLVWAAVEQWGLTVIDATEAVTAIHVNHGYPEYGDKAAMLASEEREENVRLAKETGASWYGVTHAPLVLTAAGDLKERAYA